MLRFQVSNKEESFQFEHATGPIVFGRDPKLGEVRRVLRDKHASANQLRVEELNNGVVRLENLSGKVDIELADGTTILTRQMRDVRIPLRLTAGMTLIEICLASGESIDVDALQTISQPIKRSDQPLRAILPILGDSPDAEQLTRWFERVVSVQRAAACSAEFYLEIAQAAVELIGLDCALVLLRKDDGWQDVARFSRADAPRLTQSDSILERVCRERLTFYQSSGLSNWSESLTGVRAVVASPVLDGEGETVVGVLYGAKLSRSVVPQLEIRPLDAQLVQVLAAVAGSGIARMRIEAEVARRHVQFELFFSRELAGELDRNPEMLAGQNREVTIVVSDIRGFSRIAERLGPCETCNMMGDVLEQLTVRIHEHGGVVVDYLGDGILSMWNAPTLQTDHAARACRAALAMLDELPNLNERWADRIGVKLALGIGVNTGEALVGNTGSRQRLKYGALGNTVNLASRVEGATKALGVPVLITGATHSQLADPFATRRLCTVRVVGIETPVSLYELRGETAPADWLLERDAYEAALTQYEQGHLSEACRALFPILEVRAGRYNKAALTLVSRAVEHLRSPTPEFDPVIPLDQK